MASKVYVDGEVGTTGLRIRKWLSERKDLEILSIPEELRKNDEARRERVLSSDVTILCLPDDAARQVAGWVQGTKTRLIDASTAHRVADGWVFGMPELTPTQRDAIRGAQFVSNPGCWSGAFLLLARPLIDAGQLSREHSPAIHGVSGYTGGGRSMITRWEDANSGLVALPFESPYAFARAHKHIPEMMKHSGLRAEPMFTPSVGPFPCGMRVQVQLPVTSLLPGVSAQSIWQTLAQRYEGEPFVRVLPLVEKEDGNEWQFSPLAATDTNRIDLHVVAHPSGHVLLIAILDNLGKGASGTAIQSLNLILGLPETTGLPTGL